MEKETECYRFEKYDTNNNSLFDKSIDCTYIIHLEDNGRLDSIQAQLKQYIPTRTIYIVFNKGFRKCEKNLYKNISYADLTHSYIQIFQHAKEKEYNNILILEDDFIFDTSIKDPYVIRDIETFLIKNRNTRYIYSLGTLPIIQLPSLNYTYTKMNIYALTSHSIIYSKKMREYTLKYSIEEIGDWDGYLNSWGNLYIKYMYYKPLCYQLFTDTENSKNWGKNNAVNILQFGKISKWIVKKLKLDTQFEPGYRIFYILSQYICILLFFIVYIIVYYSIKT